MLIRHTTEADIPQITRIYNYYIEKTTVNFTLNAYTDEKMLEKYRYLRSRNYPFLTMEEDDNVIGYAYATHFRAVEANTLAESSIYFVPGFTGKGYGRKLYHALFDEIRKTRATAVIAIISSTNTGSIEFHKKIGFKYCGCLELAASKFGEKLNSMAFEYLLY